MTGPGDATVESARQGDRAAVEEIYRSLAPRVLGYLRGQGVEDPEGITDDVFMAVIPRLPRVRGGAAGLRTLLFSVAHARAVDEHRRRARGPVQLPYEPDLDTRVVESAETVATNAVATEELHDLLGELSTEQRAVIMLRVLGDLSLEQTADVLEKSVGAVKQLQLRALRRLRDVVDGTEEQAS